jgi:hypothetical protein
VLTTCISPPSINPEKLSALDVCHEDRDCSHKELDADAVNLNPEEARSMIAKKDSIDKLTDDML